MLNEPSRQVNTDEDILITNYLLRNKRDFAYSKTVATRIAVTNRYAEYPGMM